MHISVGTDDDLAIKELAEKIRYLAHPTAQLRFDTTEPGGTPESSSTSTG